MLEKDPENLNLLLNAGFCALKGGKTDEALKFYYHANYIDPENIDNYRAIAWAEFENSNFEKSKKYSDKILLSDPDATDFLNAGHLYVVSGDFRKALELYRKAINGSYEEFRKCFIDDFPILEKLGVEKQKMYILLDYIKMES